MIRLAKKNLFWLLDFELVAVGWSASPWGFDGCNRFGCAIIRRLQTNEQPAWVYHGAADFILRVAIQLNRLRLTSGRLEANRS